MSHFYSCADDCYQNCKVIITKNLRWNHHLTMDEKRPNYRGMAARYWMSHKNCLGFYFWWSGAGGGEAADKGCSATGVAPTVALAAHLSAGAARQASKNWPWPMNMLSDGVITMTINKCNNDGLCKKWLILISTKKTKDASRMQKFCFASYLCPTKGFGM